jgi:hypothetical protein
VSSIKLQTQAWKRVYEHWLSFKAPIYIIRYEDLSNDTEATLEELFEYLLRNQNYEGSTIHKRLKEVTRKGSQQRQIYKPRKGLVNSSMDKYSPELRAYINEELGPLLEKFGYSD